MTQCGSLRPGEIFHKTQAVWPVESVISFVLNQVITLWAGRKQTSISSASETQLALGKLQIPENFAEESRGSIATLVVGIVPTK